jgi:hypothetical protein
MGGSNPFGRWICPGSRKVEGVEIVVGVVVGEKPHVVTGLGVGTESKAWASAAACRRPAATA